MTGRELVTLTAAAKQINRPRSTVKGWVDRGLLFRTGIDAEGRDLFDLAAVRRITAATSSRRRTTRR